MAKNLCGKMRKPDQPYEVWQNVVPVFDCPPGSWTWKVLKKWQIDDRKPFARWFCEVTTPMVPDGELGDVYVTDITSVARRIAG